MSKLFNHSFEEAPTGVDIHRSAFSLSHDIKTTFSQGDLIPIECFEVYPGDTFDLSCTALVRMSTPIFPVMDNAVIDIFHFFVPNRLVWNHWKEFCGENTSAPWAQTTDYVIPQLKFDHASQIGSDLHDYNFGALSNTVANRLGVPAVLPYSGLTCSDLPNRAYRLIWNEFFRDQNLQTPVPVYTDDSDRSFYSNGYGGEFLKANKLKDYFTTCLISPQKGDPVNLPLGGNAPVGTYLESNSQLYPDLLKKNMSFVRSDFVPFSADANFNVKLAGSSGGAVSLNASTVTSAGGNIGLVPDNLYADLSNVTAATVNQLRQAFAVQRLLERDARGGTRYIELLRSHFGVISPDARLQRPEYLGGSRHPISMENVVQTSSTDSTSPQGNVAGYSLTVSNDNSFIKSFVEHGYILTLGVVRVKHSYAQGLPRFLSRKRRFDFYYPALANLGEMAVLKKEILATGYEDDEDVFGYQEAWADLRQFPNRLNGEFSPIVTYDPDSATTTYQESSLAAAWTYSDYYDPITGVNLHSSWIKEGNENIANTLATTDSSDQFIADIHFDGKVVRPLPTFSIPGLIDHN